MKRAESLKSREIALKSKLDPHAKHILSDKKILLWKSLLEEYKYCDMPVVDELIEGTKLTGETDTTGLWPAKFIPSTISEAELSEISIREREAVCVPRSKASRLTPMRQYGKTRLPVES